MRVFPVLMCCTLTHLTTHTTPPLLLTTPTPPLPTRMSLVRLIRQRTRLKGGERGTLPSDGVSRLPGARLAAAHVPAPPRPPGLE